MNPTGELSTRCPTSPIRFAAVPEAPPSGRGLSLPTSVRVIAAMLAQSAFITVFAQSGTPGDVNNTESKRGKQPHQRVCVACRRSRPKPAFIRVCRASDGTGIRVFAEALENEASRRVHGRSAYICRDSLECFSYVRNRKRLGGALRTKVPSEVYQACERLLKAPGRTSSPSPVRSTTKQAEDSET